MFDMLHQIIQAKEMSTPSLSFRLSSSRSGSAPTFEQKEFYDSHVDAANDVWLCGLYRSVGSSTSSDPLLPISRGSPLLLRRFLCSCAQHQHTCLPLTHEAFMALLPASRQMAARWWQMRAAVLAMAVAGARAKGPSIDVMKW